MTDDDSDSDAAERAISERIADLQRALRVLQGLEDSAERWVTLKIASFETGFDRETLRLWAAGGSIAGRRVGAEWFVELYSVWHYIGRRRRMVAL